ncbi:MAG: CIA30 family protein [Candidatus Aminicenantes bacterium]|nr:CIA30 family protein [Candidatus Aminicenantes bacterium]
MLKSTFPMKTEKGAYAAAKAAIKQLVEADVPILAGTDAPNPGTTYGASMHRELEILVKAGLTPLEALKAATSVPAKHFGLNKRGRIQKGFIADLLLVEGDPTKNILATRNIKAVWREGVRVDRDKYKASVQKRVEAIEQLKGAPPPENSESGWISDFEGDKITANFGAGWSVSTDTIMGGKSKAEYILAANGAQGSKGFLLITGTVTGESATPWAGAFFSPGSAMFTPANLSFKKSINFWARGDGKTYSVMVFAQSHGFLPESQTFKVGPEWKEYNFPFEDFKTNGFDIMGIFIGSAVEKGEFKLQIDNVRLK